MKTRIAARNLIPSQGWANPAPSDDSPVGLGYLLLITALAAVIRGYQLTGQSLWVDEVMSWAMMRPGAGLNFLEQVRDAIQGPLYLAVTWPLLRLQDSELMLRLPAAAAGVLTIPLFTLAAERLAGGRSARLAGLLLALGPFHVWYSQEARGYAFLVFFAVAMGYLLVRMADEGIQLPGAVLFALSSAGAVWSNMSGLFLWGAMGITVLFWIRPRGRRQWGLWLLAFGGGFLAMLPWILKAAGIWAVDRLVVGASTGEALRGETTFTPLAIPYTFFTFFYGYSLGPSLRELHQPDKLAVLKDALPLLAAAAVPVALGLLGGLVRPPRRFWFLLVWIVVPFAVLVLLAVRNVKPWNPRYIAVALPWLVVWLAWGLSRLPRRLGGATSLLLVALSLFSLGNYFWNGRYAKADVRQAAAWSAETRPGVPVLVASVANVFEYYNRDRQPALTVYGRPPLGGARQADAFLDEILAGQDSVVYLAARQWYFDPGGYLPEALARRGRLQLDREFPGVTLYFWHKTETDKGPDEHR
jgi:mannosyltransferase